MVGIILTLTGNFEGVCWAVAITAVFKAIIYLSMLLWRQNTGLLFKDSNLVGTGDKRDTIDDNGDIESSSLLESQPITSSENKGKEACKCLCFTLESDEYYDSDSDYDENTLMLQPCATDGWGNSRRNSTKRRLATIIEGDERARARSMSGVSNKGD